MAIKIYGLSEDKYALLENNNFLNWSHTYAIQGTVLCDVTLKEEVILKSNINITLDKGGHYITLEPSDFSHIAIS